MAKYISLTNSNSTLSKNFRVLYQERKVTISKKDSVDVNINGSLEVTTGATLEYHTYTIKVRETELVTGYGTLADLKTFFRYNNPNGTPSNRITLVDYYSVTKSIYLIGDFEEQILGVDISGSNAWFLVSISFVVEP